MDSIDCSECKYRRECAQTLKECRDNGGGMIDPKVRIAQLEAEIEELKREKERYELIKELSTR